MKKAISKIIILTLILFASPYQFAAEERHQLAFLGDSNSDGIFQVCVYESKKSRCLTKHPNGVNGLWKMSSPYVAYSIKEGLKTTINILNLNTGKFSKRASLTHQNELIDISVSRGGDRVAVVEQAPFGKIVTVQGIYLDSSFNTLGKIDKTTSLVGWSKNDSSLIFADSTTNILQSLSLTSTNQKEEVSLDVGGGRLVDISAQSLDTAFVSAWDSGGTTKLFLVTPTETKQLVESAAKLHFDVLLSGGEVAYMIQDDTMISKIYIHSVDIGITKLLTSVDYGVKNLLIIN